MQISIHTALMIRPPTAIGALPLPSVLASGFGSGSTGASYFFFHCASFRSASGANAVATAAPTSAGAKSQI